MLSFLKKIFGAKPAVETPAPYKVEAKVAKAEKPAAKKPAAKKPRAPKKPKA